jgi:prepilin signal peptidase PulO-like enzyme (type II secretory pathway)
LSFVLLFLSLWFSGIASESIGSLGMVVLISGCVGAGFFLLHLLSSGRMMGLGDTPVAISLSLLAGSQAIPAIVFSFWIGAVVGSIMLLGRRGGPKMGVEVPFVPFLALGFLLAYFSEWNPFMLVGL